MVRRALFLLLPLLIFIVFSVRPADADTKADTGTDAAPVPTVSAETYRSQLRAADLQLQELEKRAPRSLSPILHSLMQDRFVKRADGTTQFVSGEEFASLLRNPASRSATKETIKSMRQEIALRVSALEAWSQSTFVPANAQTIIRQLENTNQIRTGPTWLQQSWASFYKWLAGIFKELVDWLERLFPAGDSRASRQIDPLWIQIVFAVSVFALISLIGYFLWRAIEARKLQEQSQPFSLSPEDSALLQLSPEELKNRAQKLADEGELREALRHLYIALLLVLDARGVWRYDPRRTNWEHIGALETQSAPKALLTPLSAATRRFDRVRYGHADCTRDDWHQFQQQVSAAESAAAAKGVS